MRTKRPVPHQGSVIDSRYEEKRIKALRMIYELKFTFDMEDLARAFLNEYVAGARHSVSHCVDGFITDRVMHRL